MKPTLLQRLFASKRLFGFWLSATSLGVCILFLHIGEFRFAYLYDGSIAGSYLLIIVTATPLGCMLGVYPGGMLLGMLLSVRSIVNGGPFQVGDKIQIIGGQHDGVITRVYSGWQGGSLRVELGDDAKKEFKDIFLSTQLLKVSSKVENNRR